MGFMGSKPHFYGSQKPQIEIYYKGPALFKTDPIKKSGTFIKEMSVHAQKPIFVFFYGLYGPKTPF